MVLLTVPGWDPQHPLMGSPGELALQQHFDLGEVETAEVPITEGSVQPSEVPRESPEGAGTSNTSLEVVWRLLEGDLRKWRL